MTLMGFSLVCGILSSMIMFNYGLELAVAGQRSFLYYTSGNRGFDDNSFTAAKVPLAVDARYNEEHALVGSIFAFTLLEMIAALWSAALCFVNDQKPMDKNDDVSFTFESSLTKILSFESLPSSLYMYLGTTTTEL